MEYEKLISEVMEEVQKRLMTQSIPKKTLLVVGSVTECHGIEEVFQIQSLEKGIETQNGDCILITHMPLALMGNLACGCGTDYPAEKIIQALLEGIPVFVLEKALLYRQYKNSANPFLYHLYSEYEDRIVQMGMKRIASPGELLGRMPEMPEIRLSETDLTDKKLLLESDMRKCHVKDRSVVRILNNCIITPLAEDFIRYHKLVLKKVERG